MRSERITDGKGANGDKRGGGSARDREGVCLGEEERRYLCGGECILCICMWWVV